MSGFGLRSAPAPVRPCAGRALRPNVIAVPVRTSTALRERSSVALREFPVVQANPKVAEMYNFTEAELLEKVMDLKKELYRLRAKRAVGQEIKTHLFRQYRKEIAQLLTVRRKKEIERGINKRQSRKIEKARLVQAGEWVR